MVQEEISKISHIFYKYLKEIIKDKIHLGSPFMINYRSDLSWDSVIE